MRNRIAGRHWLLMAAAAIVSAVPGGLAAQAPLPTQTAIPPQTTLPTDAEGWLRLAEAHATRYQEQLTSFVAEESYTQQVLVRGSQRHRRTRSEVLVLQTSGRLRWTALRDVFEVDGRPVRDREDRLTSLFAGVVDGMAPAASLLEESARYNIGSMTRTVNVPTFALAYLDSSRGSRLEARRVSRDGDQMRVRFVETARPTLTRTNDGGDLVAHGSVWLSADGRHLTRTELTWTVPPGGGGRRLPSIATVRVDYGLDPRFGSMVPVEMREQYTDERERVWCTARYSNVRRFTVETGEDVPPAR
jgi:hypothetical protein